MFKKENKLDQFESQYPVTIRRKDEVIHKFTSLQLEELLNNSTKNVAQEVVTCLIPKKGEGVLVTLENQHSGVLMNQQHKLMTAAHRSKGAGSVVSSTTATAPSEQQQELVRQEDGLP